MLEFQFFLSLLRLAVTRFKTTDNAEELLLIVILSFVFNVFTRFISDY